MVGGSVTITNSLIVRNGDAEGDIGGLQLPQAVTFTNNTVAGNRSGDLVASGVICDPDTSPLKNSIVWDNGFRNITGACVFSRSAIEHATKNGDNLDVNPQLDEVYRPTNQAVFNVGDTAAVEGLKLDYSLGPRVAGTGVDLGCFEAPL